MVPMRSAAGRNVAEGSIFAGGNLAGTDRTHRKRTQHASACTNQEIIDRIRQLVPSQS